MNKNEIKAIVTALSPISHGQIRAKNDSDTEKNILRFRTLPFILEKNGVPVAKDLYAVSGNSMRGIGRSLLFRHTYEDVLDLDFAKILPDFTPIARRYLVSTLQNGGVQPQGSSSSGAVPSGLYEEVLDGLPTLDLLGGVYICHHFNGAAKIGNLTIRAKETEQLFAEKHGIFEKSDTPLPAIDTIVVKDSRHTRTQDSQDASEFPVLASDKENTEDFKSKAIFGTEVLPAGTQFYWRNLVETKREGTLLAFRAMLALTARSGCIGGMSAKGYGRVDIQFTDGLDIPTAIKEYDDYCLAHKAEAIAAIEKLANDFKYQLKGDKKEKATRKAKES